MPVVLAGGEPIVRGIGGANEFLKQRGQEGLAAWALQPRDIGRRGIVSNGFECCSCCSTCLGQRLCAAGMSENCRCLANMVDWIHVTIEISWPNEGDAHFPPLP